MLSKCLYLGVYLRRACAFCWIFGTSARISVSVAAAVRARVLICGHCARLVAFLLLLWALGFVFVVNVCICLSVSRQVLAFGWEHLCRGWEAFVPQL